MTTQEARIKNDIPRKPQHNVYHELYFPDLRSTIFSIFTGDMDLVTSLLKNEYPILSNLKDDYNYALSEKAITTNIPIQIDFVQDGLQLSLVVKNENPKPDESPVSVITYRVWYWEQDNELLTVIAKALNEVVLQCTRKIPSLINDRLQYKNVGLIESNPIYEQMTFVYAMYNKLHLAESLPGCYVQVLMSRKRVTYNQLYQTLKYKTTLPENVQQWFKGEIVKEQTFTIKPKQSPTTKDTNNKPTTPKNDDNDDKIEIPTEEPKQVTQWALHLVDYSGQKFSQRLQLQLSAKRVTESFRSIEIVGDADIVG